MNRYVRLAALVMVSAGCGGAPSPDRPGSFSVGGQVMGLTGTGLVLRNNGVDDLPVSSSGAFVFATQVATGTAYVVTVATQPEGQYCGVRYGSGVVGTHAVSGVLVDCIPNTHWVTTLAGRAGSIGSTDGAGSAARFYGPAGVAVDGAGNVYVADALSFTIRKVAPDGYVTTLAGSAGEQGSANGVGSAARFGSPDGVAVDAAGNVYVADGLNDTIRKVTPGGVVTTFAGSSFLSGSADGVGAAARFDLPMGVAMGGAGDLYVADYRNCTIRKVTPGGVVTTFAGSPGHCGSADGVGSAARFDSPAAVAIDGAGNLYVAELFNMTIRRVTPAGAVTTLAGSPGLTGSTDGPGPAARFAHPSGVAVDGEGNVYVADEFNHTIRMVAPDGMVTTFAGRAQLPGSTDGPTSLARFSDPAGVAIDGAGNLYVADLLNRTIRKVAPQ